MHAFNITESIRVCLCRPKFNLYHFQNRQNLAESKKVYTLLQQKKTLSQPFYHLTIVDIYTGYVRLIIHLKIGDLRSGWVNHK